MTRRAKKSSRRPLSITSLVVAVGASSAWGQSIYLAKDQTELTMPKLRYISMDAEYEGVTYVPKTGSGAIKTQNLYLSPAAGIGWDYFVYHPDLLTFSMLAEPGYSWNEYSYAGSRTMQNELVLNGDFKATLLQLKPYATTFNYNRAHQDTQYNFFTSVTQDSQNWGMDSGYREGPVPFTVSFQQSDIQDTGTSLNTTSEQTSVNLHAHNSRQNEDLTDLSYQFSQYDSKSTFSAEQFDQLTTTHYLTLSDLENFGKNSLSSSLIFNDQEFQGVPAESLNASLDFEVPHTPQLRSFYDYSFEQYSTEGFDSINQLARVGLRHQLYESVNSTIDVHGVLANNDATTATLDQQSAGTMASIDYSKKLGDWGHLSVGDSGGYDYTHQISSGTELPVNDESHTVPPTGLFFLNQPLVISVQSVRYFNGTATIILVPGTAPAGDYDVITTTDPWQIQVYSTGPNHVNLAGSPVMLVDYTVQPSPTGSYSTVNNQFQVRLELGNHAGIYGRYNYVQNHATSPAFVLNDVSEFQVGADASWKGFRADANYTYYQSSFYNYQSPTFSQGYSLRTSLHSTAGIDLREQWIFYDNGLTNASPNVTYYSAMAHFDWQPVNGLTWHSEAGYERQEGTGVDQRLFAARSYLTWFIGKLDFRLGYEYQHQQYPAETDSRNYVFLRMRRNF